MAVIKKFRIKSFKKKNSVIEFENITLSYGNRLILDNISFKINEGQIFGMLGPNGVGKYSIYNLITGLIAPKSGKIKIDGVVFGSLNNENEIDFDVLEYISIMSKPLKLIFHKAIDFTPDFSKSLKSLIDSKLVDGVLTTGGKEKAIDNLELLSKISSTIPKEFEFIACGNITYENYDYIHSIIKSKFYHGKKIIKYE